jgi:putative ABC transport system permease protein
MKTALAWRNVTQSKVRSIIALCGVSFSILLMFMQLGFYGAAGNSATGVFDALDFDVLVRSRQYVFLAQPAHFARSRLEQMRAVDGVASIAPIWLGLGEWRAIKSRERWNVLTVGIDPEQRPFRNAKINAQAQLLHIPDTALSDSLSRRELGPLDVGVASEVQHHRLRIVGRYAVGAVFVAGGTMVTSRETFLRIFPEADAESVSVGLIKLKPESSAEDVAREMSKRLWPEAIAVSRAALLEGERGYWLNVKPIGIMFTSGVLVAFAAGAVVLYQVLASEVQNRLREYATLKALGYNNRYTYGVVVRQALIFAGMGFVPAVVLALALYALLRTQAMVPVTMEMNRLVNVAGLTALMCLCATFLAVQKLRQADPADLF